MVVKSKRGRRRYLAIQVRAEGGLTDEALLSALNSSLSKAGVRSFKVIQFDGQSGIIRVGQPDQRKAVEAINGQGEGPLRTVRTSGTLRSLREGRREVKKE